MGNINSFPLLLTIKASDGADRELRQFEGNLRSAADRAGTAWQDAGRRADQSFRFDLTRREVRALATEIDTFRNRQAQKKLRASELRGLAWRCVDLRAAAVTVDQRADLKNVIGHPKSEAGYRTIPLPASAIAALTVWKLACPASDADLVFPSLAKKVMSHQFMNVNIMGAVQLSAGFAAPVVDNEGKPKLTKEQQPVMAQRYTLHDFRHAAASLWIEQRVNPKKVQRWMGHSSIQVTFDTYGHLFDQAEQDSAVAAAIERELIGG